ncbi:MAG: hypothetical protein ACO2Y5_04635 [Nitrosopumilaceae archaeon]
MNKTLLQYYCGHCNNVLKELDSEIPLNHSMEPCPFCGTLLSDSLQQRKMQHKTQPPSIVFQKASEIPKLTFDIEQIDSAFHFLTLNQKICIAGIHTQKIIERLCVRAQLPCRYGGLDSKVLLIDGANSSDLYQCVDFAQQYGLDAKRILSGIISCRTFTVYQLANLIVNDLQNTIKQFDTKIVIITHLLNFFTNDPYLNSQEMQQILRTVVKSLKNIQNCLVIVSLGLPTQFDGMLLQLFSRTIKIKQSYHALSVHLSDTGKTQSMLLDEDTLEIIPSH